MEWGAGGGAGRSGWTRRGGCHEDVMDNLGMLVIIVILIHRFIGSYDTVISTSLEGLRSLGIDICTSILVGYM